MLSDETDLSVSRLVYLRLRKREPILIVTEDVLQEIQDLKELLRNIQCGNFLSQEAFAVLQTRVKQFEKFVSMDDPWSFMSGGDDFYGKEITHRHTTNGTSSKGSARLLHFNGV